jgi:glucose/mannose-6-phosphate isomerase
MIDTNKLKTLDPENVYQSIQYLPKQIEQVIEDFKQISFPETYKAADSIVISGMGGSIYNYYVMTSLFLKSLTKPVTMINGYEMPSYVDNKTLFIGSSYSGSTEETIATTEETMKKGALVTAVTAGGKLVEAVKTGSLPYYQFNPQFNPCKQPRVGLGYTIFGPAMLLYTLGLLHLDLNQVKEAIESLKNKDQELQTKAEEMISLLKDKIIIFVASEHLASNAHISRNQINETAKAFAEYHLIPELNHHLMEGLKYPEDKKMIFVFYTSKNYSVRTQKRYDVTKDVLTQQGFEYTDISFETSNPIEEFLLYLQLGSYLSFFLGIDNNVNPSLIPWVDYFKKQMA